LRLHLTASFFNASNNGWAVLVSPNSPGTEEARSDVQAAAQTIGQQLVVLDVSSGGDVEGTCATFVQRGAGASDSAIDRVKS
jgi:hypothetical protein